MSATVTTRYGRPIDDRLPHGGNGDLMVATGLSATPGTLWERVNESGVGRGSDLYWATLRTVLHMPKPVESIRQRVKRIAHDQHISFDQAMHIALAELRLETAKAAHPAGKGRAMKDNCTEEVSR